MPEFVAVTEGQLDRWFPYWMSIWQRVGRKPTEFIAAMSLPYEMIETFFELDFIYDKMLAIKRKQDEKTASTTT